MANEFIARKGIISRADSQITGSLNVSTTVTASGFSGDGSNITGVVSSSYASTASYVETAQTASYVDGYINFPNGLNVTGSLNLNGSMSASGDITASAFVGDGANVTGVISSSYALTASYAENGGGGGGSGIFAQTGSVYATTNDLEITGSLVVTGDITSSSNITASAFYGDGSQLTGLSSAAISSYTNTGNDRIITSVNASDVQGEANLLFDGSKLTVTGEVSASGDVSASAFWGDGANITGVVSSSYALTASYVENGGGGGSGIFAQTGSVYATTNDLEITGSLDVVGAFTAQTKSFLIDHQSKPGNKLIYGVLEGPEHAVYLRGKLEDEDTITFPEEWSWLIDMESITVQLTPIGTTQQLYVDEILDNGIRISSARMPYYWPNGVHCYYLVHATRKDVEPLQTVE
jgi:hypothetical protein